MQVLTPQQDVVLAYYGKVLQHSSDLKTSACCSTEFLPDFVRAVLKEVNDEVLERFYGCGSPIPLGLTGSTVLDLGCGSGRDAFVASRLVGPSGRVIGVDMTEEQLAVAQRNLAAQMNRFGYATPNVEFRHGYIEDLDEVGINDRSVDVVISNCVLNLSSDKYKAFSEIFRVLKNGGELYFSDVFSDRRIPPELQDDPVLYGECLSGTLYIEDFGRLLRDLDCPDYRIVSSREIELQDPEIKRHVGNIRFYSMSIRAFKLSESLEDLCEDYGQVAHYKGTLPHAPHRFVLDDHHVFETGKPMLVCGNTAAMVSETRYAPHFRVLGDRSTHFGAFDCAPKTTRSDADASPGSCC